ncbi:hypothetical protein CRE_22004 [Caenorhabditis remanei]|uniref:F-box domain-containing protein n=1 Tax=Caenorhabditis remanei TaxID=31234 RepID=E3N3L1_CAERE|nr:hypothetical protein CRE_22004 [Caenorhabditis remanei]
MPPFPLLRLPRLVLGEVFKSLSIGEKIQLSFCSKKVSTQINNWRLYSQKVRVYLDMYSHKIEVSQNGEDKFKIFNRCDSTDPDMQQLQIEGCTVPVICFTNEIEIFWKNHQEGFLSVIRHLLKMFKCKFSTTISYYNSDLSQPTISMLFDLQQEFKILNIHPYGSEDYNFLWNKISRSFELVDDFRILSCFDDFRPVFNSWPQKITIHSSYWFTLDYLFACPCTNITIFNSLLNNKDLDEILRKWKAGGFPNLEYLEIHSDLITNNETTILGMNIRELDRKVIQTDDGSKKATIDTGIGRIDIAVTPFE